MKPIEVLEKIMADNDLSAVDFGEKVGKSSNYVSEVRKGKTSKITPPMVRKIKSVFPQYNIEWLRTGEPPIYAADVAVNGSGNIGNGNGNAVSISIPDRVLSTLEQQAATIRMQAEQLSTVLELLKNSRQ